MGIASESAGISYKYDTEFVSVLMTSKKLNNLIVS
jgi:hypothetical protein